MECCGGPEESSSGEHGFHVAWMLCVSAQVELHVIVCLFCFQGGGDACVVLSGCGTSGRLAFVVAVSGKPYLCFFLSVL